MMPDVTSDSGIVCKSQTGLPQFSSDRRFCTCLDWSHWEKNRMTALSSDLCMARLHIGLHSESSILQYKSQDTRNMLHVIITNLNKNHIRTIHVKIQNSTLLFLLLPLLLCICFRIDRSIHRSSANASIHA